MRCRLDILAREDNWHAKTLRREDKRNGQWEMSIDYWKLEIAK